MGRAIFDDITPPNNDEEREHETSSEDHSIRNVKPLATQEREKRRARRAERRQVPGDNRRTRSRSRGSAFGKLGIWIVAVVFLVVALSAVGFVFAGKTTITLVPQQEKITLTSNIVHTAYKSPEDNELGYSVFTHEIDASESLTATGKETVEEKASGRIVVYNDYGSAPQRLIKNTRFEAPNGEIYRVRNSITVPGKADDNTPGSLEVTVYADKPGADQNVTALGTKFTIPGLKGDPRYDGFYAELKAPITGGFIGERAIVDESELNASRTKLQAQLREQAKAAIRERAPEDVEIFDGSIFVDFESAPLTYGEGGTATVREIAHISAVTFDKSDLARMLIAAAIAAPDEGEIGIDNPENLTLTVLNKDSVDVANDALIQFSLQGATTFTWNIDVEALKQDLIGKHSGALNTVMSGYPGVKSAQATIRPFWKSEFPTDPEKISVEMMPEM